MKVANKFLSVGSLALLQVVIVGNLQIIPANALYGFSLPFLYLVAIIGFYLPCVLMVAELATTRPQTGGAYIWCEQAFGRRAGFVTVAILWFSNLLWCPSLFSLVAANFAYLFDPALAQNTQFVVAFSIILFWIFTALNCSGVKISSVISTWCSVIGIIFPMLLIIACGVYWWLTGKPLAASLVKTPLIPDLLHVDNLGYLIAVVMTFFGVELTAVHAGNVKNPRRDYPMSLLLSSILTIGLLFLSAMAIAFIIPADKLSVVTGLLDALVVFFQQTGLGHLLLPVLLLVFIGNVGSVSAWMLASTRGLSVAAQHNHVAKFLQKTNRHEAPVGVLIFEAIIFTAVSGVFLLFTSVTDTFWLLLDLASQVTLIYYVILFISAIRLRYLPVIAKGFTIPGGNGMLWFLMGLGGVTSLLALLIGFMPPGHLNQHDVFLFHLVMSVGLLMAIGLPVIFLLRKKQAI